MECTLYILSDEIFLSLTKLAYMFVLGPINNNLSDMEASVYISVDRFILSALTENFFFLQKVKKIKIFFLSFCILLTR